METKQVREAIRWAWNAVKQAYRNLITDRFVKPSTIGNLLEDRIVSSAETVDGLTQRLIDGDMALADWQREMALEIRRSHLQAAMLGRGGKEQMTQADWGRTGGNLRFQYDRLANFANDIASREGLTPNQIKYRARMYAHSARREYYDAMREGAAEEGYTEERRVLHPEAEHCQDCIDLEAMGWQPIGTLPSIGQDVQCLVNDRCSFEFRASDGRMLAT